MPLITQKVMGVQSRDIEKFELMDFSAPLERPQEFERLDIAGLMDWILGGTKSTPADKLYRDGLRRKIMSRSNYFNV